MKLLIIVASSMMCFQAFADQKNEFDICDGKYKLALDLLNADFKFHKIDKETYLFCLHRVMVELAACQYRAATAEYKPDWAK